VPCRGGERGDLRAARSWGGRLAAKAAATPGEARLRGLTIITPGQERTDRVCNGASVMGTTRA